MDDPCQSPHTPPNADDAWEHVESSLDDIAQLAKGDLPPHEFHGEVLARLLHALAAVGGAIWRRDQAGNLHLDYQINIESTLRDMDETARTRHAEMLLDVLQEGKSRAVPARAGDGRAGNPTALLMLLAPLTLHEEVLGVVQILQRPESGAVLQQDYLRVLSAACELVEDFHRNRRLRTLSQREAFWSQFRGFSDSIHGSLDLAATGYAIANEGSRILKCDRVSVMLRRGSRYRLLAVSGVDSVHRRANLVRRLESLVQTSMAWGESLWYPEQAEQLPPEIETDLDAYLDQSHARCVVVVPLQKAAESSSAEVEPLGALVVERFDAVPDPDLRGHLEAVRGQATLALGNALEYGGLPMLSLMRLVRRARWYTRLEQLPKTLTIALVLGLLAIALAVIPTDFTIKADGELQPQERFHVFAPEDGVFVSLREADDNLVQEAEKLAELQSSKLELQISELLGLIGTVGEELDAFEIRRYKMSDRDPAGEVDPSARAERLAKELEGLEERLEITLQQQEDLTIVSPADGHVLTWNIDQSLANRPVYRGDHLMTIADLTEQWEVNLRIDDDQVGHVLAAQEEQQEDLRVTFILNSKPSERYKGTLSDIGMRTEVDEMGRATVPATLDIGKTQIPDCRPGANVSARIHCGRRSIGYVWLRGLIEAIQSRVLF